MARLVVVATVLAVAGYVLIAVRGEPLVAGPYGALLPAAGQVAETDPAVLQELSPPFGVTSDHVYTFVDAASVVVVQSLTNNGQAPLTVTGVESSPSDWGGMLQVKDSRIAVMSTRACCDVNVASTWAANQFQPVTISPGATTYVAVHELMTSCRAHLFVGPGAGVGFWGINELVVDYSVLGFPHSTRIAVGPYWIETPRSCPS